MAKRVLDLTRPVHPLTLQVVASPAIELLIGLVTFASPEAAETLESGEAWFEEVRTLSSSELVDRMTSFGGGGAKLLGSLMGIAVLPRVARSSQELIDRVAALDPLELWVILCGGRIPPFRQVLGEKAIVEAARGDARARDLVLRRATEFAPEEGEALAPLLASTAEETQEQVVGLLRRWHADVFSRREDEDGAVLERDAEAKRRLARSMSLPALIDSATNGLEFAQEPWIRRVILAPHIAMRPWNVMSGHDDASIICYPASDESLGLDPTAPPPRMVRLHRALGDEKRLRMLKVLANGPATLQELAAATGLAKSSAHHHLVILRSAGLVRATTGEGGRYTLRRDAIPEAGATLAAFLADEAR